MSWQVTQRLDLCSESPRGEEVKGRLHRGRKQWKSEEQNRRREVLERTVKLDLVSLLWELCRGTWRLTHLGVFPSPIYRFCEF